MTSWHSLLACPQADVTIERLEALAATTGTEPLTVDFKEKADRRVADCVASMANAVGGLVLVGITDTDRKFVGVRAETLAHVADTLATRLDPPDWLPEMFEVAIGDTAPGQFVLVIRIRPELAPRPVMVQRTGPGGDGIFWCPVRIPGGTRQATRAELAALFAEPAPGRMAPTSAWEFDAPQLPTGTDGLPQVSVDMMLKTGLSVMPGPGCPGRPLSENVIDRLAKTLDKSPLAETLITLSGIRSGGVASSRGVTVGADDYTVGLIPDVDIPGAKAVLAPGGHLVLADLSSPVLVPTLLAGRRGGHGPTAVTATT